MSLVLFDINEKPIKFLDDSQIVSAVQTETFDTMTLDFTLDAEVVEFMKNATYVGHVDITYPDRFQLYRILDEKINAYDADYTAIHVFYDEMAFYGYLSDKRPQADIKGLLDIALQGSRWNVVSNVTTPVKSMSFFYESRLSAISKILKEFDVEISLSLTFKNNVIESRTITVQKERGRITGKRYVYGSNALTVSKETSKASIFTAIIPRGKGEESGDGYGRKLTIKDVEWKKISGNPVDKPLGSEMLEIPEMTQLFGFSDGNPRVMVVEDAFSDITDKKVLIEEAYKVLVDNSRPLVEFSADVYEDEQRDLGDTVNVIRHDYGIYYSTRVFKLEKDILSGLVTKIEFGDQLSKTATQRMNEYKKRTESKIIQVNEELNKAISSADGKSTNYYGPDEPINPDENDVWFRVNPDGSVTMLVYENGNFVDPLKFDELRADIEANNQLVNDAKLAADAASEKVDTEVAKVNQNIVDLTKDLSDSIAEVDTTSKNNYNELTGKVTDLTTALADKPDKTYVNQTIDEKTGKITQTIGQIETKVNELDAVPVYTIGTDGYWYKDGVKTSTLAVGKDGKSGVDGANFAWNLIKESKTNVVSSNNNATVPITSETLTENDNPFVRIKRINTTSQPTRMSLYSNFYFNRIDKMYANKRYTFSFEARASHEATATYWSQYTDRVAGEKTTTTLSNLSTTIANKNMGLTTAWDTFSITFTIPHDPDEKDSINLGPIVTIPEGLIDNFYLDLRNWKLEEGANINPIWSPHESEIKGEDGLNGKDAMFIGATPPTDTTIAWLDTNTNSVKRWYNGAWYDINSEIKTKLNTVVDTVDEHTQTIGQVEADLKNKVETSTFSTFKQEYDQIVSTVQKTETDLSGLRESTTTQLNEQKQTLDANISKISNIEKDLTSGTTFQKIQTIEQTAEGNKTTIAEVKKTAEGAVQLSNFNVTINDVNQSISTIGKSVEDKFANMPDNITGTVKVDANGVPIAPYKKGTVWYKDEYNFTQGYDKISTTDNITLDEFANKGFWVAIKDSTNDVFDWNDWDRVSADSSFQLSTIQQDVDEIMLATQKGDLISAINVQAGRILMSSGDADGKSRLMLSKEGTYIDNALIESAHIKDAAITTAKIGDAQIDTAKIADAAVTSAKILNLDVYKVSGLTSEFVRSKWNAINSNLTVDGNQLVFSHTDGTKTVLDATGLYTRVGASKYMHSYLTYANHYFKLNAPVTAPVWVTLPPIWKGRKFDVMVSLASTAGMNDLGNESVIRNISVGHLGGNKDYVNGRFQLYGICEYYNTATKAKGNTWVDVRYFVQQIF